MTTQGARSGSFRLPILQGVLPISVGQIPAELIAGITLAALAVPEVMGYTKISGTPVITGLYTILIPMALFALFGSSRHLVVGADSATAAILAAGLLGLAATGSDEYVALAAVLAFMAAGFLILARLIGLGFMADFLSRTVLIGFLTGVGIQVALGEISGMLGLKRGGHGTLQKIWSDIQQIEQVNFYALATRAPWPSPPRLRQSHLGLAVHGLDVYRRRFRGAALGAVLPAQSRDNHASGSGDGAVLLDGNLHQRRLW